MNQTIYITGHKHPDSDSICAAITLADLYRRCGQPAVACRQGPLNEETKYILKRFHQENPLLLTDARAMIGDIDIDPPALISKYETVHHAWHVMLHNQNRSLFVVDENQKLCGIVTSSNLSYYRLQPDGDLVQLMSKAKLKDIAKTINGTVRISPEDFKTNGIVRIITVENLRENRYGFEDGIVIMSVGSEKQKELIKGGAKCLIITCGYKASEEVIRLAEANRCAIVETELDTMHVARIVPESYAIENIMTQDVQCFRDTEYMDEVSKKMQQSRVRSYPVLDERNEVVGAITRYHTINYARRKIALVDHSAENQSIKHVNDADIQAIVDHHHIGGIQTSHPITYRNVRCGSTCTIVSNLYQENGLLPDEDMSGLLLSAILSDTLNFKSATTTEMDRLAAEWLAKRAGIDNIDDYARDMLGASVDIKNSSLHDILNRDLKTYEIGEYRFAIGQTNYNHMEDVQKILPAFKDNLQKEQQEKKLDLLVMLFTDVMGEGSLFVYDGPLSTVIGNVIETTFDEHSGFDPKIISRKQQLMPKLSEIIKTL